MAGKLTASFILKLEDQLSGGIAKLQRQLEQFAKAGQAGDPGGLKKMTTQLGQATREMRALRTASNELEASTLALGNTAGKTGSKFSTMLKDIAAGKMGIGALVGGAVGGYAVAKSIQEFADYSNIVRHIAITEGLSSAGAEADIKKRMGFFNAEALASGQSSSTIATAFQDLIKFGIPIPTIEGLIPIHSRAATAYNISPEILGQAVGALAGNLKIGPEQMEGALASMALASKHGQFSVEDFSHFLPMITADFALRGATGRPAADVAFAALETVRRNVGESGQAATDLDELLRYTRNAQGRSSFAKMGIDIKQTMLNAERLGVNPLDAILQLVTRHTKGLTPEQIAQKLQIKGFGAGDALTALLQHPEYFNQVRKLIAGADPAMMNTDFDTAAKDPTVELRKFHESLTQITRHLGEGFVPELHTATIGLMGIAGAFDWMDRVAPGASTGLISIVGGFLGIVAAMGLISTAATFLGFGFAAVFWPVTLTIAAIAGLAVLGVEIYDNWEGIEGFFARMFQGIAATGSAMATDLGREFQKLSEDMTRALGLGALLKLPGGPVMPGLLMPETPMLSMPSYGGDSLRDHWTAGGGRLEIVVRADPGTSAAVTGAPSWVDIGIASLTGPDIGGQGRGRSADRY